MDIISNILANVGDYITIALSVVGTASLIAAATKNPKDDEVLVIINRIVNFLAANFGHAANKE
tara:strand:- start:1798 stop:1986 length:189 start_codon:yes stop_codon:yes gene_type:complete